MVDLIPLIIKCNISVKLQPTQKDGIVASYISRLLYGDLAIGFNVSDQVVGLKVRGEVFWHVGPEALHDVGPPVGDLAAVAVHLGNVVFNLFRGCMIFEDNDVVA